jgi:predicted transcriptional regulator
MPEEPVESTETIPIARYKQLQRQYDKRNATARKAEERVDGLEAGQARQEALLKGIINMFGSTEQDLSPEARRLLSANDAQHETDITATNLTGKFNQMIEHADEDWENEKFNAARRVLDEINTSGNLARAPEVERLIQEALGTLDSRPVAEQVQEAVAKALHNERNENSRVDTRSTSVAGGPISRSTLQNGDLRNMDSFKANLNKALEQLTG